MSVEAQQIHAAEHFFPATVLAFGRYLHHVFVGL